MLLTERADVQGVQASDNPWLATASIVGTVIFVPLYRWLYRKEDRWTLADVPGWEEEVEAEVDEVVTTEPFDFWGRFWPAFFAVMLPPVGVILGVRAVRQASDRDRAWAQGWLATATLLTMVPIIALLAR
jgi:hypothetical protein